MPTMNAQLKNDDDIVFEPHFDSAVNQTFDDTCQ